LATSLIDELQLDASNPAVSVTSLLRKVLMVAAKLELSNIPEWINKELSGYENGDAVPEYRIVYGTVKARNPFHGWIPVQFPTNDFQEMVSKKYVTESVAEIEALSKREGTLVQGFPPEAQRLLQQMFQQEMEFTCFLEKSRFEGILDEIRNRVLRWAIALDRAGIRGDGLSFSGVEKEKAHSLVFHAEGGTLNIGVVGNVAGQANVATGSHPRAGNVSSDEVQALLAEIAKHIGSLSLPAAQEDELKTTLGELEADTPIEAGKVRKVLIKALGLVGKAGETIVTVGTKAYIEGWMRQHGIAP
jgi:hypothetical protein